MVSDHPALLLFQTTKVNNLVLKVTAVDEDVFPEFYTVTYSTVITFSSCHSVVDICNDTCHYMACGHRGDESARPKTAKVSCYV